MEAHRHDHHHLDEHAYSHAHISSLRIFNVVSFIILILLNVLNAARVLRHGYWCGDVSLIYHTHFTPAPWAFSIWIVIFILQGIFVIYQAIPAWGTVHSNNFLGRLSFFLPVAWLLEGLWLVAFLYEWIWLSFIIMVAIFILLGIAYLRLFNPPLHLISVLTSPEYLVEEKGRLSFYWAIFHFVMSVNFAWISAALLVNFLVFMHWLNVATGPGVAVILAIAAVILAVLVLIYKRDAIYPLTIAWALLGVASHHHHHSSVKITGYLGSALLLICAIIVVVLLALRTWRGKEGLDVEKSRDPLLASASR